jgi:outer membrane protein assembly factor BamB
VTDRAEKTLRLSVTEEVGGSVALRTRSDGDAADVVRRHIPCDQTYEHLVRIFLRLREPETVREAARFGAWGAAMLGWTDGLLIVRDGRTLKAVRPESGQTLWSQTAGEKEKPLFRMSEDPAGGCSLVRYDRQVKGLNLTSGVEKALAPPGIGTGGRFDVAADGRLAAVESEQVCIYRNGELAWTWDGVSPEAWPVWSGQRVFVTGADGRIHALDTERRRELWSQPLDGDGTTRLSVRASMLLADNGRELAAFDQEAGKPLWVAKTGDVLLGAPEAMEGQLFAVVKPGKLRVWDARTGAAAAARDWPTWVRAAHTFRTGGGWIVACADVRNRLSVLRPGTLETVTEVTFPASLAPAMAYGAGVPVEWTLEQPGQGEGGADTAEALDKALVRKAPGLLVSDEEGFVYAVTPGREGR